MASREPSVPAEVANVVDAIWGAAWSAAARRPEVAQGARRARLTLAQLEQRFVPRREHLLERLGPEIDALAANRRALRTLRRQQLAESAAALVLVLVATLDPLGLPGGWSTALHAGLGVLVGALASDAGWRGWRHRRLGRERRRLEGHLAAKLDGLLLPQLRRLLNELLHVPFGVLDVREVTGLSEVVDPSLEVPTRPRAQLVALLEHMSAGSIGISGARGAGKTTLIRATCDGRLMRRGRDATPLGVWVSAPVRWEASEFIPFLFGEVCAALAPWLRDAQREGPARQWRDVGRLALGLGAFFASLTLLLQSLSGFDPLESIAGRLETVAFAIAVGTSALALMQALRRFLGGARQPLWRLAERRMWELRYRETVVRGWSVDARPALLGLGFARKREATATEQPITLPEVIGRYKGFIERITRERPVIVGIDELDKMDSAEDAARFLRDVKVLFGQQRCFYLVSVSDDAMSEFERRGMPLRNVFDSSFDDVLRVEPLSYAEAHAIVNGRVVGMGDAYVALCYVMSGGLPRELIRCARAVVGVAQAGVTPQGVTWTIVVERLERTVRAVAAVAARQVGADGRQALLDWLAALPPLSPGAALETRWDVAVPYAALAAQPLEPVVRDTQRIMLLELAVAAYRASTIVELWGAFTPEVLEAATRAVAPSPVLDLLAGAWLDLSHGPAAAWGTVNRARDEIGLPLHPFPVADATAAAVRSRASSTRAAAVTVQRPVSGMGLGA